MNLFKTSIGITKTIRNVSRFREILSVFARHGFDEFILKTKLNKMIPNFVIPRSRFKKELELSEYDFWKSVGYRLRMSFEELGPSFIKVGQLLSTREDLLNPGLIKELKKLQDSVRPIEFAQAREVIAENLESPIEEIFETIDENPIGVASIGIVYKAKLKSGEDVVLKVQRPKIKKIIHTDFEIIAFIVSKLELVADEIKYLGVSRAIEDFFHGINLELNFLIEANNNQKMRSNLERVDKEKILKIPKIYREYSSEKLLVMERFKGIPFNEITSEKEVKEVEENLMKSVGLFLHSMLSDGFFHADLHGGNFFRLKNDQIGLIDFGLVGVLSKKNRTNLVAILYALMNNNFENLVYEFLDVADYEVIPNHELLVKDIQDALMPYLGMSVQEMDATALTHAIVSTLSRHQIYLPREWFIIFRALMTLDGVGKSLGIDLNIFEIIEDELKVLLSEVISKDTVIEDSVWLGRDLVNSIRIVPRHLRWILKEFSKKKYVVDINPIGLNNEVNLISRSIYFMGLMIFCSTTFVAGVFIMKDIAYTSFQEIPGLALISFGFSFLTFFRASFLFKLK